MRHHWEFWKVWACSYKPISHLVYGNGVKPGGSGSRGNWNFWPLDKHGNTQIPSQSSQNQMKPFLILFGPCGFLTQFIVIIIKHHLQTPAQLQPSSWKYIKIRLNNSTQNYSNKNITGASSERLRSAGQFPRLGRRRRCSSVRSPRRRRCSTVQDGHQGELLAAGLEPLTKPSLGCPMDRKWMENSKIDR